MGDTGKTAPDKISIFTGIVTAGIGAFYGLVGFDIVPSPSQANGPPWLAFLVALVFFPAGVAVIVRGTIGVDDKASNLPAGAPLWATAIYWLSGLLAAAGLAGLASWVAFGGGTREFSMTGTIAAPIGEGIGRVAFGFGAILSWLIVAMMARAGAKKFFGKNC